MMNIEKISKINVQALSSANYFSSLLEQAYSLGILSDMELDRIQFDCLSLLAKQVERYSNGDSSSLRVEAAQAHLDSIMFTIGAWLKTYSIPDEAVAALQMERIDTLFHKGRERINRLLRSTKTIHSLITRDLMQTKNVFYNETIVDGIKGFFKLYNPDFLAQEIHITADYPVHHIFEELLGIEFIQKYLECVYFENLFCVQFSSDDIHHLLCGYDKNYELLLFNIYEQVLTAAIGCILSGRDVRRLELAPSTIHILNKLFHGKERLQIEKILIEAVEQLCARLHLSEPLKQYITGSLPQIAAVIQNAVTLETLDRVFTLPQYPENHTKLIFSLGEKMDDEQYRKVLDEIMQCRYLQDKKALIKREIRTLADYEDVLLDAELMEEEIIEILGELNSIEIAVLVKKHPVPSALDRLELKESQIVLSECLQKFIGSLSIKQRELIEQAVMKIELKGESH